MKIRFFIVLMICIAAACAFIACTFALDSFSYDAHGKRDPFVSLMTSGNPSVISLENVESSDDIKLEGIAVGSGGENIAIMNGEMVRAGSKIGNLFIKSIAKKHAVVIISGTEYTVELSEGGAKSE